MTGQVVFLPVALDQIYKWMLQSKQLWLQRTVSRTSNELDLSSPDCDGEHIYRPMDDSNLAFAIKRSEEIAC